MIRKTVAVAALALGVSGCNGLNNVDPNTISVIQQDAVAICGFLPVVGTIVGIISAGSLTVPLSVAQAICSAVVGANPPTAGKARTVQVQAYVGKVAVQGVFVR